MRFLHDLNKSQIRRSLLKIYTCAIASVALATAHIHRRHHVAIVQRVSSSPSPLPTPHMCMYFCICTSEMMVFVVYIHINIFCVFAVHY